MVKIEIDQSKCENSDCGECADVCPMEVLVLEGDEIIIQNLEECSLCEVCMDVCPQECIIIDDEL